MSKNGAFPFAFGLTGADSYAENLSGQVYPGIFYQPIVGTVNGMLGLAAGNFGSATSSSIVTCPSAYGSGSATEWMGWYIQFGDGTVHLLPSTDVTYSGASCSSSFTAQVIDGSGYTVTVTGNAISSIYASNGMQIAGGTAATGFAGSITDSNSNEIKYNGDVTLTWTDTLGVTALTEKVSGCANGSVCWNWTDVNGGSPTAYLAYSLYTLKTSYGCTGVTDYNSANINLATTIGFPDSTTLGLLWESTGTGDTSGRMSKITLRNGSSTVGFNYNPHSAGNNGLNCTYFVPNSISRATSDGTVSYTLAFTTGVGSCNCYTSETDTKIDVGGNKTIYTFAPFPTPAGGYVGGLVPAPVEIQYFPNTGTVSSPSYSSTAMKTVTYCYNGNSTGCSAILVYEPITEVDAYTNIGVSAGASRQQTKYDAYGNVIYSAQYDFGASSPTLATTIAYGSGSSCSAISSKVHNKPCTVTTVSGATSVSQAVYTYDGYGNLLTTTLTTSGSTLSNTANTYNANGAIATSYDFAGNETTYTYTSGCNNLFPTQIKNVPTGDYVSSTWNCTGGVKLTDVDPSGNTTTYGYETIVETADPWWRLSSITDPLGNETWKTYSATSYSSSLTFNSSGSVLSVLATLDGYGRPINAQKELAPRSRDFDTVSTVYNFTGIQPTIYSSVPCTTASGHFCGSTTGFTRYVDLLGRTTETRDSGGGYTNISYVQNDVLTQLYPAPSGENAKQVQNQYDGLGRLTSSCKLSSTASGNVTCGQSNTTITPSTGILTTTAYAYPSAYVSTITSSRGPSNQQQHVLTKDSLGRVTQSYTPDGGTWKYYYDAVTTPACPSGWTGAKGQLTSVVDPNGNLTCYSYDGLNRETGINANGTTCRFFDYDANYGTVPNGVTTPTNTLGRLARAFTDGCPPHLSIITDEWLSYDKDGNLTDQWEMTPNSTQYYHSSATFTGPSLLTLDLASPGEYTLTYGLDGEGRPASLTQGSSNVVVAARGVTYNAASQPTAISLGAGTDADSFTYDANTGRFLTWGFNVNSVSQTGTLTWNGNWSLEELVISDGFNSGGTQTGSFNPSLQTGTGYDDLGRLVGSYFTGSGGTWSQNDSYNDQYDNLTKSGNGLPSWAPGYSPTTNHYTCAGCTYDSDGDVTNDGTTAYTWNEFAKMKTAGTQTLVYDAFGRIVEVDTSGGDTEIWYTQLGKTAYMNGATYLYAYAPAPGGGTMLNQSGTNYYMHKDWLGNARVVSTVPTSGNGVVTTDRAFAPYGEIYDIFGSTNQNFDMFTGLTQDVLAGMYDTPNRELQGAQQGRWLSPDPAGAGWNQYAYVTNPNSEIDPTGLLCAGAAAYASESSNVSASMWPSGCPEIDGGGGPLGGPEDSGCTIDGVASSCTMTLEFLGSGIGGQCPNGDCSPQYIGGQWQHFGSWADGSSGYMPTSLAGFSTLDAANAFAIVNAAGPMQGKPIDPNSLTGKAANAYNLLIRMDVAAADITIYQDDGGDFAAVLSRQGFQALQTGMQSHPGDAFLHYPYTNGARDYLPTDSLHAVWLDPSITDYVGGVGIYMQFHTDASNPASNFPAGMWNHMMCVIFNSGC